MAKQSKLLSALQEASAEDLAALDQEIESLEQELASLTAEHHKRIDALRAARRLIDIQLNGIPQRKPRVKREPGSKRAGRAPAVREHHDDDQEIADEPVTSGGTSEDRMADRVYELVEDEGPLAVSTIASRFGVHVSAVYRAAKQSGRFQLTAGLLHIKR